MSVDETPNTSIMGYHLYLPEDFHTWHPSAKRVWLAGGLTQRQMLNYAIDQLGLDLDYSSHGSLTNRDLAQFVVAITENGGVADGDSAHL